MVDPPQLQRLKQALQTHRQALRELESALIEFEKTLPSETSDRPDGRAPQLLSIDEVCQTLGMGKSWTYRRLKSGEIPSIQLERSITAKPHPRAACDCCADGFGWTLTAW